LKSEQHSRSAYVHTFKSHSILLHTFRSTHSSTSCWQLSSACLDLNFTSFVFCSISVVKRSIFPMFLLFYCRFESMEFLRPSSSLCSSVMCCSVLLLLSSVSNMFGPLRSVCMIYLVGCCRAHSPIACYPYLASSCYSYSSITCSCFAIFF
jgi:hypothetical protein